MADEEGAPIPPLSSFVFEKILKEDSKEKKIVVLGHFKENNDKQALLIFEKTAFGTLNQEDFSLFSSPSQTFHNDIYAKFTTTLPPNFILLSTIYPCTTKHITKHLHQPKILFRESYSNYLSVTLPYIVSRPLHQTSWVENILEGRKEVDRVIFRDEDEKSGFVVTIDLKWDLKKKEDLYCVAIVKNKKLKSLRDLGGGEMELLKKLEGVKGVLGERYGLEVGKIRAFLHYQPTYYWLHVHYVHVDRKELGAAVFLNDVIENISLVPDYYQKATLEFAIGEAHPLSLLLKEIEKEEEKETNKGEKE